MGVRHELSGGLLVGGKDVAEESARVSGLNVLVCTPGRLLQHMDETPGFDCSNLRFLVLDEADRVLDMGFRAALDAILANLPKERQTMLLSATQTDRVRDLARLSLRGRPERLAAHTEADAPTPARLAQAYLVLPQHEKIDAIWSFVKSHLHGKTIIFLETCAQARFLFEAFRRLRPGVPLRALHGRMSQARRERAYYEFCEAKDMVLFATDVAARGLDFAKVAWVVQADAPEDAAAYVHRAGRAARLAERGRSLLLLTPAEERVWAPRLEKRRIPIKRLQRNPTKAQRVAPALAALLSKEGDLREVAQRALAAQLRAIAKRPKGGADELETMDLEEVAASYGLPSAPQIRRRTRTEAQKKAQEKAQAQEKARATKLNDNDDVDDDVDTDDNESEEERGVADRAAKRSREKASTRNGGSGEGALSADESDDVGTDGDEKAANGAHSDDDDDDDFLVVRRREVPDADAPGSGAGSALPDASAAGGLPASLARQLAAQEELQKKKKKKKRMKIDPARVSGSRVVFDEDGDAQESLERPGDAEDAQALAARVAERAAKLRQTIKDRDREDREAQRELRKAKRVEKRLKRLEALGTGAGAAVATLGIASPGASDDEDNRSDEPESDGDLAWSDSDDEKRPVARADPSQVGMRAAKPTREPKQPQPAVPEQVEDQEALALKLLRARR